MEPTIVHRPGFTVVGPKYHGTNANGEIPQMWGAEFLPRVGEIQHVKDRDVLYGVCGNGDAATGEFDYIAGVEVEEAADLPAGMASWVVPEQTYAVFPSTLPTLRETLDYIYNTWLPQSSYARSNGPDLEYYGRDFCDGQKVTLYIPIVRSDDRP